MADQTPAPGVRVEAVRSRKFPGAERHWLGDVVVAAHCTPCQRLTPADELHADRAKPGGRRLLCGDCHRAACAAYAATPTGAAKQRKRTRRAVESGRAAEVDRRWRERHPGRKAEQTRAKLARYAARTDAAIAADRARLRPDGLKKCRAGHWSPLTDFSTDRTTADGLRDTCREHAAQTDAARRVNPALPSWESRDLWTCVYTGLPFSDVEHIIPRAAAALVPGVDLNDSGNLAPSSWEANRGPGGKFDRPVLDYVEDLHGPGVIAWLFSGGVEWRTLSAA